MKEVEGASVWSEERELYQIFAKQTYDYSKSSFYDAKYDLRHWENEPNEIERKNILDEINRVRRKIQNLVHIIRKPPPQTLMTCVIL